MNPTAQIVVFDVSGSMKSPLKLRSNAQDATQRSDELDPKRVETVFDVVCRLAEDSIESTKNHDAHAAVLCFGLKDVQTCDLLALLEDRAKYLEIVELADHSTALPLEVATQRLAVHGLGNKYLRKAGGSESSELLYTVNCHEPLVMLLRSAGAPYCGAYVTEHISSDDAGRYFLALSDPSRKDLLEKLVDWLPMKCKNKVASDVWDATNRVGSQISIYGRSLKTLNKRAEGDTADFLPMNRKLSSTIWDAATTYVGSQVEIRGDYVGAWAKRKEENAVSEATRYVDSLLDGVGVNININRGGVDQRDRILSLLKSIPIATPRLVGEVIQLTRRLQKSLNKGSTTCSQTNIDWSRLLDDIEPYLYGYTPMRAALCSAQDTFRHRQFTSKTLILISDGKSTDGDPRSLAKELRDSNVAIFTCMLTSAVIKELRKLHGPSDADKSWPSDVKAMFEMSSTVSYESGAVQALRRHGWKIPPSGQVKLLSKQMIPR
ncbi:hypothetical protein H072_10974 [Dactylellina haptotyla CBS 200.50]|uniref:VWFA domain-containing protein n=1 Tax=Dactylellina haptotyla (strain CBS 200.50) TaxID=1284197 RepID=S7ZYR3_DACHA|nr:hypothetical protein H072_10974 [Dactylellina haptotyla CBS 200.50]